LILTKKNVNLPPKELLEVLEQKVKLGEIKLISHAQLKLDVASGHALHFAFRKKCPKYAEQSQNTCIISKMKNSRANVEAILLRYALYDIMVQSIKAVQALQDLSRTR